MRSIATTSGHRIKAGGLTPAGAVLATLILTGCGGDKSKSSDSEMEAAKLDQQVICISKGLRADSNCKPGQRVAFMPDTFGNEQMPVAFATINCDLRYAVVLTNGAVTCVYLPARAPADSSSADPAPAPASGGAK